MQSCFKTLLNYVLKFLNSRVECEEAWQFDSCVKNDAEMLRNYLGHSEGNSVRIAKEFEKNTSRRQDEFGIATLLKVS
jgi:hypothetical protein